MVADADLGTARILVSPNEASNHLLLLLKLLLKLLLLLSRGGGGGQGRGTL
jgi:hypothetical protein